MSDDDDTRPWPIPDEDEETAIDMQPPSFFDRGATISVRTTHPGVLEPELDVLECKGGSTTEPLAWSGRCRAAPLRVSGAAITHPGLVREGNEDAFVGAACELGELCRRNRKCFQTITSIFLSGALKPAG